MPVLVTLGVVSGLALAGCAAGPGAAGGPAVSPGTTTSSPAPALPSPTWTRTVGDWGDLKSLARVAHAAHALEYAYTGEATVLVRVPADRPVPADRTVGPIQVHFEHSRFTAASVAALKKQVGDAFEAGRRSGENSSGGYGYEPRDDVIYVEGVLPKALTEAPPDPRLMLVPGSAARLDGAVGDGSSEASVGDPGNDAAHVTAQPAG